ncbi:MAG: hypothetical protein S4CHLAM7_06220 [Chlamydiae bacterium]|nr:hypothetical protein [Chlamydiota bacterium]
MFVTMLAWGSWANTTKLDKNWRFELYYWDYSFGVLLTAFIIAITLGSFGSSGPSFFQNISQLAWGGEAFKAFLSGIIFNGANLLLVAAITMAGMSVAFPIGIGIALVLGTFFSYLIVSQGNIFFLFLGILFVLLAIFLAAKAYRKKEAQENPGSHTTKKGILISVLSGILMSFFYPILASSIKQGSSLSPYSAVFFFGIGVVFCTLIFNPILMKKPIFGQPLSMNLYFQGTAKQHFIGLLGGIIWCIGLSFNIIASTNAGPAIAYAFGQGATLIAAIWGVFIWKEFAKVRAVFALLFGMFLFYVLGLVSIGIAKLVERGS